ncbi:MAG: hypothetical protein AAGI38_12550 [Bacteroidota bacterium]
MTGEEKRKQLKEQYKQDLKKRKEFLNKVKGARNMNTMNKAVGGILDGLNDDSKDWIDKLNEETALTDAKMDMALEGSGSTLEAVEQLAKEAEAKALTAQQMVEQMKREMGLAPEPEAVDQEEGEGAASTDKAAEEASAETPKKPGKTLGDF